MTSRLRRINAKIVGAEIAGAEIAGEQITEPETITKQVVVTPSETILRAEEFPGLPRRYLGIFLLFSLREKIQLFHQIYWRRL